MYSRGAKLSSLLPSREQSQPRWWLIDLVPFNLISCLIIDESTTACIDLDGTGKSSIQMAMQY